VENRKNIGVGGRAAEVAEHMGATDHHQWPRQVSIISSTWRSIDEQQVEFRIHMNLPPTMMMRIRPITPIMIIICKQE